MSLFNENVTSITAKREGVKASRNQGLFENSQYRQFQGSLLSAVEAAGDSGVLRSELERIQMPGKNDLVSKQIAQSAIAELAALSLVSIDEKNEIVKDVPGGE